MGKGVSRENSCDHDWTVRIVGQVCGEPRRIVRICRKCGKKLTDDLGR